MASSRFARALSPEHESPHSKSNEHQAEAPVAHPLLRLQRQFGNATVSRLIAQRQEIQEEELQAKHDPLAQRQEEEMPEDEGEELMAKHDPLAQRQEEEEMPEEGEELMAKHDPLAQRQEEEEMPEEGEELMAKHDSTPTIGLQGGPVGSDVESTINSKRGSGTPLESGLQQKMETSLNTSLADVRVHSDEQSDALNRNMTAKAFTTGSDIFLRSDVSQGDHSTMAHEVAHVVQQRSMDGGSGGMSVGAADSSYEKEADEVAHAINTSAGVQREPEQQL